MKPAIDYAHPQTGRQRSWRKIFLVIAVAIAAPLLLIGGFVAWFEYQMTRNGVVIMVDNQSSARVDAMVLNTGAPNPVVSLTGVAAGQQGERDENTWRTIAPATFRVRVGSRTYVGEAGYLLDDDGPHRFWVKAFDDHVVVTRQSNEGPWDLTMRAEGPASRAVR